MFTLDQVVPWGRSFDEYRRMFALSERDLGLRIVGCGDGPAGFNAEATRRGGRVVSCDPLYRWDAATIRKRIAETRADILRQTAQNAGQFVWDAIRSVEELERIRMTAMTEFLDDYPRGREQGRYVDAELPALPFENASFDLALCSHLLFLYSVQLDEAFHRDAIREMCRVAREVRIFPLLALDGERSRYVDRLVAEFAGSNLAMSIENVGYEFQRGGNQMLLIRQQSG
jgi:hypothetical protein